MGKQTAAAHVVGCVCAAALCGREEGRRGLTLALAEQGLDSSPLAAATSRLLSSMSGISNVDAQCFSTASISCARKEESTTSACVGGGVEVEGGQVAKGGWWQRGGGGWWGELRPTHRTVLLGGCPQHEHVYGFIAHLLEDHHIVVAAHGCVACLCPCWPFTYATVCAVYKETTACTTEARERYALSVFAQRTRRQPPNSS